jgi:AcrR family transcriptional regulator
LVHYHFPSVQALLAAASMEAMRAAVEDLGPVLDRASTAAQMVELLLGSLDRYPGSDPTSLLFAETFLAATRDDQLHDSLGQVVEEFRELLTGHLARVGVQAPDETAAVLAAAVDGLVLHRALGSGLTGASVAPVLRRLLLGSHEQDGGRRSQRATAES